MARLIASKVSRVARFDREALQIDAAEENAASVRLKLEEIRAAVELCARLVLRFERFAVLAEKASRVFGRFERQVKDERCFLRLGVFKNGVAVAVPGGREGVSPLLVEKLLQHFLDAEFAHHVFLEQFPIGGHETFPCGQCDFRRADTFQIKVRLHDLLGRDRRILEDQMQVRPARVRLQECLSERGACEVRKQQ